MSAGRVLSDPFFVLKILRTLSSMKYKVKRQFAPETPVEWLEFRPTLVPSILVSRLWANEGTSVLWENYPHLLAMADMELDRKQYYANKVRKIFIMSPPPGSVLSLEHLEDVRWPLLESLEMDVDFARHGDQIRSMLNPNLKHIELSGFQSGGPEYFSQFVLPAIFGDCTSLESIRFGPGPVDSEDYLPSIILEEHISNSPTINAISLRTLRFTDTTPFFTSLATCPDLSSLEIDLDPGPTLPFLHHPPEPIFTTLTSLYIMLYPEVAITLLPHLQALERLQLDICRALDHPSQASDAETLDTILTTLSNTPKLQKLQIGIGALSETLPSITQPLKLSGAVLSSLPSNCPRLTDITIFAAEPGTIDGSAISSSDFDTFCTGLPNLQHLSLKLHPSTTGHLSPTLLSSLRNCAFLTTLKIGVILDFSSQPPESSVFHNLTELGFAPPLFLPHDEPTEEEKAYIRAFAAGLEHCFPELEILEVWGEELGERYVEPFENTLASVWEFLMGEAQDLWDEDDEEDEGEYELGFGEALPLRVLDGGHPGGVVVGGLV